MKPDTSQLCPKIVAGQADNILYGRSGAHGLSSQESLAIAIEQLRRRFQIAQEETRFSVEPVDQEIVPGTLADLLDETPFAAVNFPEGLNEYLREVPALDFSITLTFEALQRPYPEMADGQEIMYAEVTMAAYLRRLGFQQVAAAGAGGRTDSFAGDFKTADDRLTLSAVIIDGGLDLSAFGIHPGILGYA